MSIFNNNSNSSFIDYNSESFLDVNINNRRLDIGGKDLNVRCYTNSYVIGLLKLFGKVVEFSQGKNLIYADKASLIKQYKIEHKPQGLSNNDIIRIIQASYSKKDVKPQDLTIKKPERLQIEENGEAIKHIGTDITPKEGAFPRETFKKIKEGPFAGMRIRGGKKEVILTKGPLAGLQVEEKEAQYPRAHKIIDDLAIYMKGALLSEEHLRVAIIEHYETLGLMNNGEWIPQMKEIGKSLLPEEGQSTKECEKLIGDMVKAIKQNPYFLAAIDNLDDDQLKEFAERFTGDKGKQMIHYMVPYAFALNGLTAAFAKDPTLFKQIDRFWNKQKEGQNVQKYIGAFGWIKYKTIGSLERFIRPVTGEKDIASFRKHIELNIAEAWGFDRLYDHHDNAKAAMAMIENPPDQISEENSRTGAGPSIVEVAQTGEGSDEYKVAKLRPNLPKEWADLYTVWNFTFCSNFGIFPGLSLKLLIPSVNDYANDPSGYIHHRGIALYLYFQFTIFRGIKGKDSSFLKGWHDEGITRALGAANAESALNYRRAVSKAKATKSPTSNSALEDPQTSMPV